MKCSPSFFLYRFLNSHACQSSLFYCFYILSNNLQHLALLSFLYFLKYCILFQFFSPFHYISSSLKMPLSHHNTHAAFQHSVLNVERNKLAELYGLNRNVGLCLLFDFSDYPTIAGRANLLRPGEDLHSCSQHTMPNYLQPWDYFDNCIAIYYVQIVNELKRQAYLYTFITINEVLEPLERIWKAVMYA